MRKAYVFHQTAFYVSRSDFQGKHFVQGHAHELHLSFSGRLTCSIQILSTYPCVQPSESLAFRTSLSKYLETLRHQSIHSASARFGTKTGPNGNLAAVAEFSEASWWKDVVVRKSLLEECSGEK